MKKKHDAPVLLGIERSTDGCMAVWCPYCADFHRHGNEQGHVRAHCIDDNSPYHETGYYIKKAKYYGRNVLIEEKEKNATW